MEIIIQYLEIDSTELQTVVIEEVDFFDPLSIEEQEEGYNIWSTYTYQDDYWHYINKTEKDLKHIHLSIKDKSGEIADTYAFWNEGKNWIRTYYQYVTAENKPYHSITIQVMDVLIANTVEKSIMLTFKLTDKFWTPIMHNISLTDLNTSEIMDFFIRTSLGKENK